MLRLLIEQFTRDIRLEMRLRARRAANTLVWSLVAGLFGLIGLVFLLVAATLGLTPELGAAGAAAAVGGGTLLVAVICALIARPRRPRPLRAPAYVPPPAPIVAPAADPSAMRQDEKSGKTAMAVAGAALLAGLILGRRL